MRAITMRPVLLRSLRLAWWVAGGTALLAACLLLAARLVPAPPSLPASVADTALAGPAPSQVIAALAAGDRAGMIEELRGIARLVDAGDGARARIDALIAREERVAAETPPAIILTALTTRLDHAIDAMRDAAQGPPPAPPGMLAASLERTGGVLALLAALLALAATPLALAPGLAWREVMGAAGDANWGADRHDLWGALARLSALRGGQAQAEAASGERLRLLSQEIEGTLRETGAEAGKLRAELGRAQASLQVATQAGERMADRSASAVRTLEETTGQIDDAVGTLTALPALLAGPIEGLQDAARRAGDAATAMAAPRPAPAPIEPPAGLDRLERAMPMLLAALERLAPQSPPGELGARVADELMPMLSEMSSADAEHLSEVAAMMARVDARLETLLQAQEDQALRLAQAAATPDGATLDALREAASALQEARAALDAQATHLGETALRIASPDPEAEAARAASLQALEASIARLEALPETGRSMLAEVAAALDASLGRLPDAQTRIEDAATRLEAVASEQRASLEQSGANPGPAEALGRIEAVAAALEAWPAAATSALEKSAAALEARLASVPDAATRIEAAATRLEAMPDDAVQLFEKTAAALEMQLGGLPDAASVIEAAADRLALVGGAEPADMARFDALAEATRTLPERIEASLALRADAIEARLASLPELGARLDAHDERLVALPRAVGAALEAAAGAIGEQVERLPALAARLEAIPDATERSLALRLDPLQAAAERLGIHAERLDALPRAVGAALAEAADAIGERVDPLEASLARLDQGLEAAALIPAETRAALAEATASMEAKLGSLPALGQQIEAQANRLAGLPGRIGGALEKAAEVIDGSLAGLPALGERIEAASRKLDTVPDATREVLDSLQATAARLGALPGELQASLDAGTARLEAGTAKLALFPESARASLEGLAASLAEQGAARAEAALAPLARDVARLAPGVAEAVAPVRAAAERVDQAANQVAAALDRLPARIEAALEEASRSASMPVPAALAALPIEIRRAVGDGVSAIAREAQNVAAFAQEGRSALQPLRETEARLGALAAEVEASVLAIREGTRTLGAEALALARSSRTARAEAAAPEQPLVDDPAPPAWRAVDTALDHAGPPSVAQSILAALGHEPGDERRQDPTPGLEAALRQLDGVESAVLRLTGEAEAMAEEIAGRRMGRLPAPLLDRAPELLGSLDETITRLRSVATAIALACDASRPED